MKKFLIVAAAIFALSSLNAFCADPGLYSPGVSTNAFTCPVFVAGSSTNSTASNAILIDKVPLLERTFRITCSARGTSTNSTNEVVFVFVGSPDNQTFDSPSTSVNGSMRVRLQLNGTELVQSSEYFRMNGWKSVKRAQIENSDSNGLTNLVNTLSFP